MGVVPGEAIDVLWDGAALHQMRSPRNPTRNTHGTDCTFAAAITAHLAAGRDVTRAVVGAKDFVWGTAARIGDTSGSAACGAPAAS